MKIIGMKRLPCCHGQSIKAFSNDRVVPCRNCGTKYQLTVVPVTGHVNDITGMDELMSCSVVEIKTGEA